MTSVRLFSILLLTSLAGCASAPSKPVQLSADANTRLVARIARDLEGSRQFGNLAIGRAQKILSAEIAGPVEVPAGVFNGGGSQSLYCVHAELETPVLSIIPTHAYAGISLNNKADDENGDRVNYSVTATQRGGWPSQCSSVPKRTFVELIELREARRNRAN